MAYNSEQTITYAEQIKVLEKQKSDLLKKIDNSYDAFISHDSDNNISKEYWQRRDTEFRQKISTIDSDLDRLKGEKPYYLNEGLASLELLKSIVNKYENANREQKGAIIHFVVLNCEAIEKSLVIKLKKPFSLLEEGLLDRWRE